MAGLLEGVKVIESAQLFTGDYAGQLLADEGADVVKFESPFRGDYLRDFLGQIKPHTRGHSPLHIILNRNKRSVAVDLRTEEGKQIFWKALAGADVFLDGNTTGAIDKLGLGYREQRKVKSDIVYAQVTGLGAVGPYAGVPTHGQSMTSVAGGTPARKDADGYVARSDDWTNNITTISEVVSGPLYLAYGVAAALYRRSRTGQGAYLDVAASDAGLAAAWMSVVNKMNRDRIGADETGMSSASTGGANSKYNLYETKDGKFMLAALIEHHFYEHFCKAAGREDLLDPQVGFATRRVAIDWGPPGLRPILAEVFRTKTAAEWMDLAAEYDFVVAPLNDVADLLADPHLRYREALIEHEHPSAGKVVLTGNPIKVEGQHYTIGAGAPFLGQHTTEYLRGLGIGEAELDRLHEERIIG